jgi:hypothetical protein
LQTFIREAEGDFYPGVCAEVKASENPKLSFLEGLSIIV